MSPSLSDALRRATRTFVIATLAIAIPGLLGWLNDLTEWAHSSGTTQFPDAHGLMFIFVAAISAGFIALLNFIWVLVENASGKAMLRTPTPPAPAGGQEGYSAVLFVLAVVVVILVLFLLVPALHR